MAESLEYTDIYGRFLSKITDFQLMGLSQSEAEECMGDFLQSALSRPYVRRLFSTFTNDTDSETITFELKNPDSDASADNYYILEVLAKSMVVEWLTPKVENTLLLHQMFGGKETKWYSQSQHLNQVLAVYENTRVEIRKMIRDRGYTNNPYVNGERIGDSLVL